MLNKLRRSNSIVSTRSGSNLASLSDIVHEEDEILHSDNDLQNWSLPKVDKKEVSHGFQMYFNPNIKLKLLNELMLLIKIVKNVFYSERRK